MLRYQEGGEWETTFLIERLSPELFRFFMAQQATRGEANDLLQDTWLRIHRVRHTYRAGAPLLPWVFAIARRVRIDAFRKRSRISRNEIVPDRLPERAGNEGKTGSTVPDIYQLMAVLPESQREVVTLLKINGLTLQEISRATGLTVGAVKQKASRAYATLREKLRAEGYGQ